MNYSEQKFLVVVKTLNKKFLQIINCLQFDKKGIESENVIIKIFP